MRFFMETILIESGYYSHLFNDDPVRPHLTEEFRLSNNRLGLALIDNHNCKAAVCIAVSNEVPTNEKKKYPWEKEHQHNLTGSVKAYKPSKITKKTIKKYKTWHD